MSVRITQTPISKRAKSLSLKDELLEELKPPSQPMTQMFRTVLLPSKCQSSFQTLTFERKMDLLHDAHFDAENKIPAFLETHGARYNRDPAFEKGGMYGKIYRYRRANEDLTMPEFFALKIFNSYDSFFEEDAVLRRLEDGYLACQESHIAAVAFTPERFILMENMSGVLLDFRKAHVTLPVVFALGLGIARALKCFLSAGLYYTDVKTTNTMYACEDNNYRIYLGDYGSAFPMDNDEVLGQQYGYSYPPLEPWENSKLLTNNFERFSPGYAPPSETNMFSGLAAILIDIANVRGLQSYNLWPDRYNPAKYKHYPWSDVLRMVEKYNKSVAHMAFLKMTLITTREEWEETESKKPEPTVRIMKNLAEIKKPMPVRTSYDFEKCKQIDAEARVTYQQIFQRMRETGPPMLQAFARLMETCFRKNVTIDEFIIEAERAVEEFPQDENDKILDISAV